VSAHDGTRGRLNSLDGIRAFAVIAVLLYHAGVAGVGGGLLGVDVFFVLSGFLITSLLCEEHLARGAIRLGHFWAGRARRLLPGLFLLLLGVGVYAWIFRDSLDVSSIRGDAISTLLYVANWHFIFSNQSYFSLSTAPSPLLHMWSLAVEEQFYLVWPLVAFIVLRHEGSRFLAWVAGVGAAASALLMASMYVAGFSVDRLYYGTDTRAQALLVGAVLGAVASGRQWRVVAPGWAGTRRGRRAGATLGLAGAAFLLWALHTQDGEGAFLYEGGFLLVALAAAAVIVSITSWRSSLLARICSLRPLTYIGRISYGLYLYHWPLFLVLDHAHTGLSGLTLLVVRLASAFFAAAVSFHVVEQPIRTGSLSRGWRGLTLAASCAVATAVVVVAATLPAASVSAPVFSSSGSKGLSASEHRMLAASHAFTSNPVRLVMLGDSVAVTASVGLQVDSKQRYGVKLYDGGVLGCDLDLNPSRLGGVVYTGKRDVNCGSWQTGWKKAVTGIRPQVVGLLIGRFELADHLYRGKWVHVGQKEWDAQLLHQLNQAIRIVTAGGAHVALFTFPYIDPPLEQLNGSPYPENEPSRVNAWNRLLRQVAHAYPKKVTLIDLNKMLDPNGHFTNKVDGVVVRWPDDGIHITLAGGEWLQPRILPEIAEMGLQVRSGALGSR
jgi:peptidoglycan/LPS O-acetylase OafA/YrhL